MNKTLLDRIGRRLGVPARAGTRRFVRHGARACAFLLLAGVLAGLVPAGADAKPPRVTSITLSPSADKDPLIPGEQQAITAIATYSDNSTEDVTQRLVYTSSKPEVVEVVGPGAARALRGGDAEIKAYDPVSGRNARTSVKFKVAKLERIDLLPENKVVRAGRWLELRALGTYANGRSGIDLTDRVSWSSDKTSVAQVERRADGSVVVHGIAAGKAKILALEPLDRVKSDSGAGRMSVVDRLSGIVVEPGEVTLRNGETAVLAAHGVFEGGVTVDLSPWVEWTSTDPGVAMVSEDGVLTAVGMGSTRIGAVDPDSGIGSSGDDEARIDVLGGLLGLAVAPASVTLPIGGTARLGAFAVFEGRDDPVALDGVRWRTTNSTSVVVDGATGAVRCANAGAAAISFTERESGASSTTFAGDARVACVSDVATVRVSPAKKLVGIGKSATLRAFLLLPDGTERDITTTAIWTSSRPDVISVSRVGELTRGRGVAPGVAVITAVDPVTGTRSDGAAGISSKLSVTGPPRTLKIFPAPTSSAGIELPAGTPFLLKARVDFEGGATQGANNLVLWTSSDPSVLRISNGEDGKQPGLSTPLRGGEVTVTIQYPKPGASPPQFPPAQPMFRSVQVRVR